MLRPSKSPYNGALNTAVRARARLGIKSPPFRSLWRPAFASAGRQWRTLQFCDKTRPGALASRRAGGGDQMMPPFRHSEAITRFQRGQQLNLARSVSAHRVWMIANTSIRHYARVCAYFTIARTMARATCWSDISRSVIMSRCCALYLRSFFCRLFPRRPLRAHARTCTLRTRPLARVSAPEQRSAARNPIARERADNTSGSNQGNDTRSVRPASEELSPSSGMALRLWPTRQIDDERSQTESQREREREDSPKHPGVMI